MSKIPVIESKLKKPFGVDLVLIDADILRYEIGSVCIDHPYIKGVKTPAPVSMIEGLVRDKIKEIISETHAKSFLLFLTGKGNFRFDIAKQAPYKGNREDLEKPYHWDTVDVFLRREYKPKICEGNEADDVMGEIQEAEVRKLRNGIPDAKVTAIASRDKDLRTQEGWHYSWMCGEHQPAKPLRYIPYLEAKRFFFQQMLTGDNTDNIIGCGIKRMMKWGGEMKLRRKGVGETAAIKLLKDCKTVQEMYEVVKEQYEKVFFEDIYNVEEVMLENAILLYIGQEKDKQFKWEWILDEKVSRTY